VIRRLNIQHDNKRTDSAKRHDHEKSEEETWRQEKIVGERDEDDGKAEASAPSSEGSRQEEGPPLTGASL
jgi:hypothetical protein